MNEKSGIDVWIVLVTYNGMRDIPSFFSTLSASRSRYPFHIVVVDNASRDSTVALVRELHSDAVIIENNENVGFAAGSNQGIEYAQASGATHVYLANQDLEFSSNWLDPLIQTSVSHPTTAALQSKMYLAQNKELINSCGNALHLLGFGYTRGYQKSDREYMCEDVCEVAYSSFSAVLLSSDAIRKIGMLDENYFMYHEDSDWCWRARLAGYSCVVIPRSIVYHRYEFSKSILKFYYIERNRLINFFSLYSIRTITILLPLFLFWECGVTFFSLLSSIRTWKEFSVREKIRSYIFFLRWTTWRAILEKRRRVQATRVVSDKTITRLFTCDIVFQDVEQPLISCVANPLTRAYWALARHLI